MSKPESIKVHNYPTVDEYEAIFSGIFPGSVSKLKKKSNYITGSVYWDGFRDLCLSDRLELLTILVRDPLGLRGVFLSTIFLLADGQEDDETPTKRWYEVYGAKKITIEVL